MMFGIQFIVIIFALLMIYITFLHFKKRELSIVESLFFGMIWVGALVFMLIPQTTNFILQTFKIYRLLDLATVVGFMALVIISYSNFFEIRRLKKKIEQIVRQQALKNAKN